MNEGGDGTVEELDGTCSTEVAPGEIIVIETPGGGYGKPGD